MFIIQDNVVYNPSHRETIPVSCRAKGDEIRGSAVYEISNILRNYLSLSIV